MSTYLREAKQEDIDILFEWVNDPISRESAFNSEIIEYEDHKKWFLSCMQNRDCIQLILMVDGVSIGQVRFNVSNNRAELDYGIAPQYRSMGYGSYIVSEAVMWIRKHHPEIKYIVAKVKAENIASHKVLGDAGFSEVYSCYGLCLHENDEV